MILNQLAIITITITAQALFFLAVASVLKRTNGYKVHYFDKLNFAVNFNVAISLVLVAIACVGYFFGWVK
jgi:hypothetical protein